MNELKQFNKTLKHVPTKKRLKFAIQSTGIVIIVYLPIVLLLLNLSIFIDLKMILVVLGSWFFFIIPVIYSTLYVTLCYKEDLYDYYVSKVRVGFYRAVPLLIIFILFWLIMLYLFGGLIL